MSSFRLSPMQNFSSFYLSIFFVPLLIFGCASERGVESVSSPSAAFARFSWEQTDYSSFSCFVSGKKTWIRIGLSKTEYDRFLEENDLSERLNSRPTSILSAINNNSSLSNYSIEEGEKWLPSAEPIAAYLSGSQSIVVYHTHR